MYRTVVAALPLVTLLLSATPALAADLYAPWECEEYFRTTQGNFGTNSHNDGWGNYAWDWAKNFGDVTEGELLLAPASGEVRLADDSSNSGCGNSGCAKQANYLTILVEGNLEVLYMHIQHDSLFVGAGDFVERGQPVARVGSTGWSTAAHLHFQLQDSTDCLGESGTYWNYYCRSTEASFVDIGKPAENSEPVSSNCGGAAQGDLCMVEAGAEAIIDDSDGLCARRLTQYWWERAGGFDGNHHFTYAIATGTEDSTAWWRFQLAEAGDYVIAANIPAEKANFSEQATYRIEVEGGASEMVQINQQTSSGMVELATMSLPAETMVKVTVVDNTGEAFHGEDDPRSRKVVFDALSIKPATMDDPGDDPMDDPIDDPGDDPIDDPGDDPVIIPGDDPIGDPVGDPGEDPINPEQPGMDGGSPTVVVGSGSCSSAPGRAPGSSLVLWLLGLLGWSRRRLWPGR